MAKDTIKAPKFDDIVFANRNKEYGAYSLRKKYKPTVIIALMIGSLIIASLIIGPYLNEKTTETKKRAERSVEVKMEATDAPVEQVAPPPPPPPPPADVVQQARYVPPVVVDSVKPEEEVQLMTADEAETVVQNTEVTDMPVEVKEEVQEEEAAEVPFVVV